MTYDLSQFTKIQKKSGSGSRRDPVITISRHGTTVIMNVSAWLRRAMGNPERVAIYGTANRIAIAPSSDDADFSLHPTNGQVSCGSILGTAEIPDGYKARLPVTEQDGIWIAEIAPPNAQEEDHRHD